MHDKILGVAEYDMWYFLAYSLNIYCVYVADRAFDTEDTEMNKTNSHTAYYLVGEIILFYKIKGHVH